MLEWSKVSEWSKMSEWSKDVGMKSWGRPQNYKRGRDDNDENNKSLTFFGCLRFWDFLWLHLPGFVISDLFYLTLISDFFKKCFMCRLMCFDAGVAKWLVHSYLMTKIRWFISGQMCSSQPRGGNGYLTSTRLGKRKAVLAILHSCVLKDPEKPYTINPRHLMTWQDTL